MTEVIKDPDPNCLHCVLAEHVQRFLDTHPDKNETDILGEILQVAADWIISTAPPACASHVASAASRLLCRLISEIEQNPETRQ